MAIPATPTPHSAFGYGKLDVKAAVDRVGNLPECLARRGDSNGDEDVNVLDVVTTVNHILDRHTLGEEAGACADVDSNLVIDILLSGHVVVSCRSECSDIGWLTKISDV